MARAFPANVSSLDRLLAYLILGRHVCWCGTQFEDDGQGVVMITKLIRDNTLDTVSLISACMHLAFYHADER